MNNIKLNSIPFQAQVSQPEAQEQVKKIHQALDEMKQAEGWEEYMEMSDVAEMQILKAKLEGALPYLEHIAATGEVPEMPSGGTVDGAGNPNPFSERLRNLNPGWNGDATLSSLPIEGYEEIENLVRNAEFEGFVYIDDDGDQTTPLELAFKASATTQKIETFNRGNDIVYVETFLDESGNEQKRFYVGIDHAVNVRADIALTAHDLDHAIQIDLSRSLRISDGKNGIPAGETNGFVIHGTDANDTILGSQGVDNIEGHKGDDTIRAFGGDDSVFGDDSETFSANRAGIGMNTELADGSDTIDGGVGNDSLQGGGGINYGFEADIAAKSRIHHNLRSATVSLAEDAISGETTEGWKIQQNEPGQIVFTETEGVGSSILDLKMPTGFDMVSGEAQPDGSLKLNYVGITNDGKPQTFTVIIKGALRNREARLDSPFTLRINGNEKNNMIDLSSVNFGNNIFIADTKGANDMVLAPQTVLTSEGLSFQDLIGPYSRISERETTEKADSIATQEDVAVSTGENKILIQRNRNPTNLHIDPQGFDKAYVTQNPDNANNLYVILVKEGGEGLPSQTLLVEIENYKQYGDDPNHLGSWLSITSNSTLGGAGGAISPGERPRGGFDIPVITLRQIDKVTGSIIDAGAGDDFVFHGGEGKVSGAESQAVGNYQTDGSALDRTTPAPADPLNPKAKEDPPANGVDPENAEA